MSRVGSKIREIRTAKGISQKQLAKMVGVSEKFIDEAEWGKKVINDELITRISKALGENISEMMIYEAEASRDIKEEDHKPVKAAKQEVQEVWNDAFNSVLKTVSVYDYSLSKVITTRQLPIISNKVEGLPKDKVLFIEIEDNDMIGFRIVRGDTALAHMTQEVENNSICLVDYNGQRAIRQIKRLDGEKVLLLSNRGSLSAETVNVKGIKVLARLDRLEIKL